MKPELHFCLQTVDQFVAWDYNWKPLNYNFQVSPMGWKNFPNWDSRLLLHGTSHTVCIWMLVGPVWWYMCCYSPLQFLYFLNVCISSVAQSCLTLCDPMDYSTPGFLVLHHLPELAQTHVHWVSYAIQPSHPLSSPSPPVFNLSHFRVFSNELALYNR